MVPFHKIPTTGTCPEHDCNDAVPLSLPSKLSDALEQYTELMRVQEHPTTRSITLSVSICRMIKAERQREIHIQDALDNGWPVLNVDFKQIPDRIIDMTPILDFVMFDSTGRLYDFPPSIDFRDDLDANGLTTERLAAMPSILDRNSKVLINSQPG